MKNNLPELKNPNRLFTLPNILTLCNLACGCAAVVYALSAREGAEEYFDIVFWLVVAAAAFDFIDGAAARLTGQYSEIGKQLDSLADLVSFGVAPSAALYSALPHPPSWLPDMPIIIWEVLRLGVFSVALFSALRLAKFNVDESQRGEFTGLPTPAAGLAVVSLVWMVTDNVWGIPDIPVVKWTQNAGWWWWNVRVILYRMLPVFIVAICWLLVCPIRMFKLKSRYSEDAGFEMRNLFLAASALLLILFGMGGVFFAVVLYVAMNSATGKKRIIS